MPKSKNFTKRVVIGQKNDSRIKRYYNNAKRIGSKSYKRFTRLANARPLLLFSALLAVLFTLIIAGNFMRKPQTSTPPEAQTKYVDTYQVGTQPTIEASAQIEKSGVIEITALSGGIVGDIFVHEGEKVTKGKTLVSLASNYYG